MTKAIAFYLPQFHAIPENDAWWGQGFTEWDNVKRATPLFEGHQQPHIPEDANYYNLLEKETQERQINLAKKFGVAGFCFYYYWFNGKTLLEQPVFNWLNDSSLDFPFCLCWANENWTRRWDGLDNEILIDQKYSPLDDIAFIRRIIPYLKDPRYIRIDNKPLLIVYRPGLLPNPLFTTKQWRYECKKAGLEDIFLAYVQSFDAESPHMLGFDAAIEFPPIGIETKEISHLKKAIQQGAHYHVYDYEDMLEKSIDQYKEEIDYIRFPGVCPNWDNTARRQLNGASILDGSTPSLFKKWVAAASEQSLRISGDNQDLNLLFVNAWNEWAEGCHLEPDIHYGNQYLKALEAGLSKKNTKSTPTTLAKLPPTEQGASNKKFAIIVHAFYLDVFTEMLPRIAECEEIGVHLYITCPEANVADVRRIVGNSNINYTVLGCANHGRDVLPFINVLPAILNGNHSYLVKLHTKKTLHRSDGQRWLNELTKDLLGRESLLLIEKKFVNDPGLGIIGPSGNVLPAHFYLGSNVYHIRKLLDRLQVGYPHFLDNDFVAGTMFAARVEALVPLSLLNLQPDEFEKEAGQVDGTLAHAVERIISISADKAGFRTEAADRVRNHYFPYAISTDLKEAESIAAHSRTQFNPVGLPPISSQKPEGFIGWIDYPNEGERVRGNSDMSGWCFLPEKGIQGLRAWIGNRLICDIEMRHRRDDILTEYPHIDYGEIGFQTVLNFIEQSDILIGNVVHLHLEVITPSNSFVGLTKAIVMPSRRSKFIEHLLNRSSRGLPETKKENPTEPESLNVRPICFYLPQFHAIPENDEWWGEGFTEWVNVAQGTPLFPGHEQPRIPADLGFYDLRNPEVHLKQIELATHYGIEGFCYYIYWFGGQRLLELPTQRLLTDSRFNSPFCLCWANENWSRRWDGGDNDILMQQSYSPDDDIALITEMSKYFRLDNYIRVNGKPIFTVYNLGLLPDPKGTAKRWREHCHALGIGDIHLIVVHSYNSFIPEEVGFDAAVEFPPLRFPCSRMEDRVEIADPTFPGKIYDWMEMVHNHIERVSPEYTLYPAMVLGWDNVARRGARGHIFHGANPRTFGEWAHAISRRRLLTQPYQQRLLFINAWNEWAEGTYLEPDRNHGYAYLNALAEGLRSATEYGPASQ